MKSVQKIELIAKEENFIPKNRDIILVFGRTGSGKSFLVHKLLKELNRYIIIDSQEEYNEGIIIENLTDFLDYVKEDYSDIKEMKIILRFRKEEETELFLEFATNLKNYTLILEEAEIYISALAKKGNFLTLVRQGRHNAISIIAIARRVVELHNDIRANCNKIYCFKQIHKRDIDYMKNLGFENIETLEKYQFEEVDF